MLDSFKDWFKSYDNEIKESLKIISNNLKAMNPFFSRSGEQDPITFLSLTIGRVFPRYSDKLKEAAKYYRSFQENVRILLEKNHLLNNWVYESELALRLDIKRLNNCNRFLGNIKEVMKEIGSKKFSERSMNKELYQMKSSWNYFITIWDNLFKYLLNDLNKEYNNKTKWDTTPDIPSLPRDYSADVFPLAANIRRR